MSSRSYSMPGGWATLAAWLPARPSGVMSSAMAKKTLVTGANRGIGLALCQLLRQRGDEVVAVCRTSSPELDQLGVDVVTGVEVTSDEGVARLVRHLGKKALDLVILNAGILRDSGLDDLDLGDVSEQLAVNAVAPLRLAHALLPNLHRGAKLALITSRMGSIGDNGSGGYYGYRMSKAALNAAGMSLAHDLAGVGVSVAILHPGYVRTDMTGRSGNIDPDDAAKLLVDRIDAL